MSFRLEPLHSNRNCEELDRVVPLLVMCPTNCRCRTCEKCGPLMGWRTRQAMLSKAHLFRVPAMLSLTVDRKRFESPEAAHKAITEGGYVRRLMRLFGIRTWFWVLEFQTKTGEGWPHWHILLDLADCGGRLDLARAWHLWRDKWGLGGLDLSAPKSFENAVHAVYYVTKYLTKMPEAFPPWVLLRKKAIRFVGGAKCIGSLTGQPPRQAVPDDPAEGAENEVQMDLPFRAPRTALIFRMAQCGMKTTVFFASVDVEKGEGCDWQWKGTIDAPIDDVVAYAEQGMLSVRCAVVEWGEKEATVITDASIGGAIAAIRRANKELADRDVGYAEEWLCRVGDRQDELFSYHYGYWEDRKRHGQGELSLVKTV